MPAYLKISLLPLTGVVCLIIIWLLVKPVYDSAKALDGVTRPQLESLVQRENEMQQRAEKLSSEINGGEQVNSILYAIPEAEDAKDLLSQFEFIVNQEQMSLTSLSVEQKTNELGAVGVVSPTGKSFRELTGNFEVRGSYSQFKQLMANLAKLNRVVNIKQLEVANATTEEGATTGKFTLTFTAYWQPPITTEDVRSGLESLELGQKTGGLTNNLP